MKYSLVGPNHECKRPYEVSVVQSGVNHECKRGYEVSVVHNTQSSFLCVFWNLL